MGQLGDLSVSIEANLARFKSDMDASARITENAMAKIAASTKQSELAIKQLQDSSARMKGAMSSAFAGAAAAVGLQQIIGLSDGYTKFNAQLKLATSSQEAYAKASADLERIARSSQANLAEVGSLYARIAKGREEYGFSQQKVAQITEAVNLGLKVSGATAQESVSAQLQLSQAFASGTLRGEEFNAVNEAGPRLMKALADGIGVPVGRLKEMASQGQITSEVMGKALAGSVEQLTREAQNIQTIAGSFTVLNNAVMQFVGAQNQGTGAASALSSVIQTTADNLDLLAAAAGALLVYKVADWALTGAQALTMQTAATVQATAASAAKRAADIAEAQGNVAKAAAEMQAVQADIARIQSIRQQTLAELQSSQMTAQATQSMGAHSAAILMNKRAVEARSLAMAEAAALGQAQAAAEARAIAMTQAHTAAVTGLATAQNVSTGAMIAGSRALGMLGGWMGLVTMALTAGTFAWMAWGNKSKEEAQKASVEVKASTEQIIADMQRQIEVIKERNRVAEIKPAFGIDPGSKSKLVAGQQELIAAYAKLDEVQKKGTLGGAPVSEKAKPFVLEQLQKNYQALVDVNRDLNIAVGQDVETKKAKRVQELMEEYQTGAQKAQSEIKKLKAELGDAFTPELEQKIKEKHNPKQKSPGLQIDKATLNADLDAIRNQQEVMKNIYAESERVMEMRRAAGLLDDKEYYESKAGFIQLNAQAEEKSIQAEITRLEREKLNGKDRIENEKKIAAAQADLQKLRDGTAFKEQQNALGQEAANQKLAQSYGDIVQAANEYIESIQRRNANEIAGMGKGDEYRQYLNDLNAIEDKFIQDRQNLERDKRNQQIDQETYDKYLQVAKQTYQREVEAYKQKDQEIKNLQGDWLIGAQEAMANYRNDALSVAKNTEQVFTNAFSSAEDAIVKFVKTGKISFKDFANSVIEDMIRMAARQFLGNAMGGGKGGGLFGAVLSIGSMFAGASTGGALVGDFPGLSVASAAGGYDIPAGVNPMTQLHEKEMVLPQREADIVRGLANKGGTGGGKESLTIINQTTGRIDNVVEQRISPTERALIIQEAVKATAGQVNDPNSNISRSLNRNLKVERSR